MRCPCGVDVHAHVIPGEFPRYLGGATPSGWPGACRRDVMIDGKNCRAVSGPCLPIAESTP